MKYNIYDYDVEVDQNDSIISLITCTRFFGVDQNLEFYVSGRLLRGGETTSDYKVEKAKNYKDVEKVLEGDGEDEEDV